MSGEPDERGNVALETSMGDIEVELYWNVCAFVFA